MDESAVLKRVAARALELVPDNSIVGLGTGRAATEFVRALGERARQGFRVRGIPTSEATTKVAQEYGIPLLRLDEVESIDITVDGADEVDPNLDLIKGYGGALVREKIVAAASKREIILVGSEKLVAVLGSRGKLPVEVIPFAYSLCRRRLADLGLRPALRQANGAPFASDGGNYILDCGTEPIRDPQELETSIRAIPGVLGSGLFLGMTERVIVGDENEVRELTRKSPSLPRRG
ncbi:MAG: ribose-5-phosphate isomerase RpiA [Deltaproteobacteria bacterium]|nr:ribose-5-phosphate isomerase RpiA [Deltaproteobacteria bacterium]